MKTFILLGPEDLTRNFMTELTYKKTYTDQNIAILQSSNETIANAKGVDGFIVFTNNITPKYCPFVTVTPNDGHLYIVEGNCQKSTVDATGVVTFLINCLSHHSEFTMRFNGNQVVLPYKPRSIDIADNTFSIKF